MRSATVAVFSLGPQLFYGAATQTYAALPGASKVQMSRRTLMSFKVETAGAASSPTQRARLALACAACIRPTERLLRGGGGCLCAALAIRGVRTNPIRQKSARAHRSPRKASVAGSCTLLTCGAF